MHESDELMAKLLGETLAEATVRMIAVIAAITLVLTVIARIVH